MRERTYEDGLEEARAESAETIRRLQEELTKALTANVDLHTQLAASRPQ